jgi:hypothetical protein
LGWACANIFNESNVKSFDDNRNKNKKNKMRNLGRSGFDRGVDVDDENNCNVWMSNE